MSLNEIMPPIPEVVHLPTLFRRIRAGAIRVPAFQREFVWKEAQVIDLLKSVYSGYPVGSLLLWKVDRPILKLQATGPLAFPETEQKFPLSFVLDGMQRLSTLYGVCNYEGDDRVGHIFNVMFDLVNEEFIHYIGEPIANECVPLSALFTPRKLMETQIRISSCEGASDLITRLVRLHAAFQEYMIPIVTIETQNVTSVVQIFERVNSTGTRLSSVDFMRAVTWSDQFDLTKALYKAQNSLRNFNFTVPDDTLVKALGIVFGLDPLPGLLLTLRDRSSGELEEAMNHVETTFLRVSEFVRAEFQIYGSDYIPYEGQMLVLFKAMLREGGLEYSRQNLVRWYWATGFNEALRGKPDHFVARSIRAIEQNSNSRGQKLTARVQTSPFEFRRRRLIRGRALSATVASLLAVSRARSVYSGEEIPAETYMSEFSSRYFMPILPDSILKNIPDEEFFSGKLICNVVVASEEEVRKGAQKTAMETILNRFENNILANEVFRSQMISEAAIDALIKADFSRFLDERANTLFEAATVKILGPDGSLAGFDRDSSKIFDPVYIEARPRGVSESVPVSDYVVEDRENHILAVFETQLSAINWAKQQGQSPLVARSRRMNDKRQPEHWRIA